LQQKLCVYCANDAIKRGWKTTTKTTTKTKGILAQRKNTLGKIEKNQTIGVMNWKLTDR
jgi:phage gp16-like protein